MHESKNANPQILTYALVWESEAAIITLAIVQAGTDSERWEILVRAMSQFQPEALDRTLNALKSFLQEKLEKDRFAVWDALRKEANRHRTYSETEWALKDVVLAHLDEIINEYQPDDHLLAVTWLFDDWMPDVPEKSGNADPMVAINGARAAAIRDVFAVDGVPGLMALAQKVKLPQHVADASRSLNLSMPQLMELLNLSLDVGGSVDVIGTLAVAEGIERFGDEWVDSLRTTTREKRIEPERIATLFLALKDSQASWSVVRSFGDVVEDAYWKQKHASAVTGSTDDLLFAINSYVSRGRPMAAIESSNRRLSDLPSARLMQLLSDVIPKANAAQVGNGTMFIYYIERIFDELETRLDISPQELAKMEFVFLSSFSDRKKPLTLHRLMVENAEIYLEAICAVFKPSSGELIELSEGAKRIARAAYRLLEGLRILPGQTGEEIDFDVLRTWCVEVRELAKKLDREAITDQRIGHLLAHAPSSSIDKAWPHVAVRRIIESLASDDVERGLVIERYNMRGSYSKTIGEGGQQERALAQEARNWSQAMPGFPKTAAVLNRIAEGWTRDADAADIQAVTEALRR